MAIRAAAAADLPALCALMLQLASDDASVSTRPSQHEAPAAPVEPTALQRRAFAEICASAQQRLFVLEDEGRVAGTATLLVVPSLGGGGRPRGLVENVERLGFARSHRGYSMLFEAD